MPIATARTFEDILLHFAVLRHIFKAKSKRGHFDLHKHAENFFRDALNLIYGWNLENLNKEQSNYPAIDLGDEGRRIAVQVTAQNNAAKINKTLEGFAKHDLYKNFDRLIIFIITDKKNYRSEFDDTTAFDKDDIWDIDDLLQEVEGMGLERMNSIYELVRLELRPLFASIADPGSIFARAAERVDLPALNANRFLEFLGMGHDDNEETQSIRRDICAFYKILTELPEDARGYLAAIVHRGTVSRVFGGEERIVIFPKKLVSLLQIETEESIAFFKILEQAGIADIDENEGSELIAVSYNLKNAGNLVPFLRQFCKNDQTCLEQILVRGDFRALDEPGDHA